MWHFDLARKYAIDHITSTYPDQNVFDRIDLAVKCQVFPWLVPACEALCSRSQPITEEEGKRLGFRCLTAVCRVREGRPRPTRERATTRISRGCGSCYNCEHNFACAFPVVTFESVDTDSEAEELAAVFMEARGL